MIVDSLHSVAEERAENSRADYYISGLVMESTAMDACFGDDDLGFLLESEEDKEDDLDAFIANIPVETEEERQNEINAILQADDNIPVEDTLEMEL